MHRASANISANVYEVTINGRTVKKLTATGRFPFRKSFWDDVALNDVTQIVSQQGDVRPIPINGGANVAYRMEVANFVSPVANFRMPPKLTFALMGDSFSSGQGAPMLYPRSAWIDNNCHRSRYSGLYRAMNQFIKGSNKAVDYVFKACEGAIIKDMLDEAQPEKRKSDGTPEGKLKQRKAQVDLVKDWMTDKGYSHLNAALFSIGGNNVGFANSITHAIISPWIDATELPWLRSEIDVGFAYINGLDGYRKIDTVLTDKLNVKNIIILGYPDLIHNIDGSICTSDCPHPDGSFNTIQRTEFEYGNTILSRLTSAASSAGDLPNWHYANLEGVLVRWAVCLPLNRHLQDGKVSHR